MSDKYIMYHHTEEIILEYIQSHDVSTRSANFQDFFERVATKKESLQRSNGYIHDVDMTIEIRRSFHALQDQYPEALVAEILRSLEVKYGVKQRKLRKILGLKGNY